MIQVTFKDIETGEVIYDNQVDNEMLSDALKKIVGSQYFEKDKYDD